MKTFITIEEALKNGNNTVNQNIKSDFIGKHVYANVGQMVEYILKQEDYENAPFSFEDVQNISTYPEYYNTFANFAGGTETDKDAEIERLQELLSELQEREETEQYNEDYQVGQAIEQIETDIEALEGLETEYQDIMEWWAVSQYLFERLQELGHPVLDAGCCYVWGRCTSGQAILLDYSITKICADMGILEGQASSWVKQ